MRRVRAIDVSHGRTRREHNTLTVKAILPPRGFGRDVAIGNGLGALDGAGRKFSCLLAWLKSWGVANCDCGIFPLRIARYAL
jgi:hypothetical protein